MSSQGGVHGVVVPPLDAGLNAVREVSKVADNVFDGGLCPVGLAMPGIIVAGHSRSVTGCVVEVEMPRGPFVLQHKVFVRPKEQPYDLLELPIPFRITATSSGRH